MNMNWTRSTEWLPALGQYLVYYAESKEYKICDFDGKVFSYTYWKNGAEMVCELFVNPHLWWKYLGRPE